MENNYLDLYDYRCRVFALYRERNEALRNGEHPQAMLQWFRDERDRLLITLSSRGQSAR